MNGELFASGRIVLITVPVDMRNGVRGLCALLAAWRINPCAEDVWCVFLSRTRRIAKILHCDDKGILLIDRRLTAGCFRRLTGLSAGKEQRPLTRQQLINYMNGLNMD
jgi:hypothetical protein